jgi:hypothetical protein
MRHKLLKALIFVGMAIDAGGAYAFDLSVGADSTVKDISSGKVQQIKATESLKIVDKTPMWVESPGKVPVLLVPLKSESGKVKIDSPNVSTILKEETEIKIDQELSEITLHLTEVHRFIADRKFTVALQKISELKAKYPNIKFLEFIEASAAFLNGDRDRAMASLNKGLEAHPNYAFGLELKKKLGGGKE